MSNTVEKKVDNGVDNPAATNGKFRDVSMIMIIKYVTVHVHLLLIPQVATIMSHINLTQYRITLFWKQYYLDTYNNIPIDQN